MVRAGAGHNGGGEAEAHGKEFGVGGVFCKALEESGKIMCARPPEGEKRDFTDKNIERVIIEFESLQERSKDGTTVGKAGGKGHMFDHFSEQEFNFTDPSAGTYQGLDVKNFNFSCSLAGPNAVFTVMAYMFEESGNITFGNETTEMRKGMLKFNIQVTFKLGWSTARKIGWGVRSTSQNPYPIFDQDSSTLFMTWPKIEYLGYDQNGQNRCLVCDQNS